MKSNVETFGGYVKKIIDLSRKNRLLKYPKNAKSVTFNISLQKALDSFGSLNDLKIEFIHRPILNLDKCEEQEVLKGQEAWYAGLTDIQGEKLINTLDALRLEAKRKFEDYGLHTLFLTVGKVRWKEPSVGSRHSGKVSDEYDYNAPLLLIPIRITESNIPQKKTVIINEDNEDITVNKVLNIFLEKEYKARALKLDEEGIENWFEAYQNICLEIKNIFSELKIEFEVVDEIQIGHHSFVGQEIYADLSSNEGSIIENEFINALCTHTQLQQENLNVNVENPDVLLTAKADFNVTEADRSQLQVIQNVINGNHLNIQGPPGTGKSQTIVNIIANLFARKKKVLLVCEKQVALEVVLARLTKVGLHKLCLPLFQKNADKKSFAKSILDDRDSIARIEQTMKSLNDPLLLREKRIDQLRTYAKALGEVVEPLTKSLHWVHGEFIKHKDSSFDPVIIWEGPDPLEIDFDEYKSVTHALNNLMPIFNLASDNQFGHWKNIARKNFSPDFVIRVNHFLTLLRAKMVSIGQSKPCAVTVESIVEIRKLIGIKDLVNSIQPLDETFSVDADLSQTIAMFTNIQHDVGQYIALNNSVVNKYHIPFNWDDSYVKLFEDVDGSTVRVSQIKNAALSAATLKNRLNVIVETINFISCDDINIDTLMLYKDLLLLDPIVNNIKNLDSRGSLESVIRELNSLRLMYDRLGHTEKVIDKYEIMLSSVESVVNLDLLSNRFNFGYRTFLRYFNSQYYKDCQLIDSWCNASTSKKHYEYVAIAKAINIHNELSGKFNNLLQEFNYKHARYRNGIESYQIPLLYNNIKSIKDWLNKNDKSNFPEQILSLQSAHNVRLIQDLYTAVDDVKDILNSSWCVFQLNVAKEGRSFLSTLINAFPVIQYNINNKLRAFEAIGDLYKKTKNIDSYTINQVKQDALEIDALFIQLNKIQVNLKNVSRADGDTIIANAISCPDKLHAFIINIQNLDKVIAVTAGQSKSVMVKQAAEQVYELQQVLPSLEDWLYEYTSLIEEINRLFENSESMGYLETFCLNDFIKVLDKMLNDQEGLEKWVTYRRYVHQLESKGQGWFIKKTENKSINNPSSVFAQSLWSAWLEAYYAQKPELQSFSVKEHVHIINEFKKLEKQGLEVNAMRILADYAPEFKCAQKVSGSQDQLLVHQSQLKMRHKSIRKLVKEAGKTLLQYKPCWMMSPLTLSSYIPYGSLDFDVIIFDEASQMRVEHALGGIARAKQVIIFGDESQLPPTAFFEMNDSGDQIEDEGMVEDYESILHATKEILPGANGLLSHHYRSQYENLIAFSNHYVYGDRLITFPNPDKSHNAIQFDFVDSGVFDGGKGGSRSNEIEAKRVVEICIKQITEEPGKSLGVISFSRAQEVVIRDKLQDYLKTHPQFQYLLDETSDAQLPFFIKNLESVQGDERDVIILSVGYGKDKRTGEIYNRFGPINSQHGYRRLNVAITRAKEKIICVSSIKFSDIRNADKSRGAFMLQKYLEYAERGIEALDASLLVQDRQGVDLDSPFEEEVERALQQRGYIVHRQVGVSGFKIDLAIVNPKNNQAYILGIECDGASYHSSYSARMNDRVRQDILERLGWKLYRIWSQHWISHKDEIIDDISRMLSND